MRTAARIAGLAGAVLLVLLFLTLFAAMAAPLNEASVLVAVCVTAPLWFPSIAASSTAVTVKNCGW